MPVPNGNIETSHYKKQRRWSLIGILSKKKKLKKSQESIDFCPYDGKINTKVAQNSHLERSNECLIEQYTCSPRLIRRCNSLQHTNQVSAYSNTTSQPKLDGWKSSQQSVLSSSSSACYSDIGVYRSYGNSNQSSSYYVREENEPISPMLQNVPFRCSSEIGHYRNRINYNQRYFKCTSVSPKKLIGKKIPPPPPPRDPNVKAMYYIKNNRLVSRESDSTYFSQGSDDNFLSEDKINENETECLRDKYRATEPPRSRRPIQICDVETLSTESENSVPRTQSVEEALKELEDIYNSLGLSDEDLLDRAERRDLPTLHQNMRYQSSDELDCITFNNRVLPKVRRSGVPDIVSDDMAYRRLNKKESKRQSFVPGSFLLVLPTVYNVDKSSKPSREPDVTLDDVVFRSRRQQLNFLKVVDPQPPFGIPLGPIVGAAPSDYLHAVPEGRYKPSFHPRKIPDTVEDDLAFRALRKENKYKTCIDFAFIHRNRLEIVDPMFKLNTNRRIKNDTHWIVKNTATNSGKNRMKFTFDGSAGMAKRDGDGRHLMVVKIDQRKPIVLSGFTLDEASVLSKSFFCTNLAPHEPRAPLRLMNGVSPKCSEIGHRRPGGEVVGKSRENTSSFLRLVEFDGDDDNVGLLLSKGFDGYKKNQPNFRELIEREEYAPLRYPLSEEQSNVVYGDGRNEIKYRFTKDPNAFDTPSTCDDLRRADRPSSSSSSSSSQRLVTVSQSTNENRTDPARPPENDSMPGYLEVCLYITVYVYQLFSVNAYSTLVALVFLIALHVFRRLS